MGAPGGKLTKKFRLDQRGGVILPSFLQKCGITKKGRRAGTSGGGGRGERERHSEMGVERLGGSRGGAEAHAD